MNTKEYIESGILETYILGALTQEEEAVVEANIAMYPELQQEVKAIEDAMIRFAEKSAKMPAPSLEDKIWNTIQTGQAQKTIETPVEKPRETKTIPLPVQPKAQFQWKYAAIWIALVGSVVLNFVFWNQTQQMKGNAEAMNYDLDQMKAEQKKVAGLLDNYQKQINMMADTGMQTIVMHTLVKGHPMAATLYWSKDNGAVYVNTEALPAPPKGMQYQLWVIQDGKPVDMGVLPNDMVGKPDVQKVVKTVTTSQAFAISLEKEGGSPVPTAEKIYVMGKVL